MNNKMNFVATVILGASLTVPACTQRNGSANTAKITINESKFFGERELIEKYIHPMEFDSMMSREYKMRLYEEQLKRCEDAEENALSKDYSTREFKEMSCENIKEINDAVRKAIAECGKVKHPSTNFLFSTFENPVAYEYTTEREFEARSLGISYAWLVEKQYSERPECFMDIHFPKK